MNIISLIEEIKKEKKVKNNSKKNNSSVRIYIYTYIYKHVNGDYFVRALREPFWRWRGKDRPIARACAPTSLWTRYYSERADNQRAVPDLPLSLSLSLSLHLSFSLGRARLLISRAPNFNHSFSLAPNSRTCPSFILLEIDRFNFRVG